jgi:integrase
MNGKLPSNAAAGVSIKLGKPARLRSKAFKAAEATALLTAALNLERGNESPRTFAAKKWVPLLCAYTGARVGELAQLRKEDIRREGGHAIITITPEAGTVKTNEARDVVLHPHVVELGFVEFVRSSAPGHLFLKPSATGDVLGPLQGVKNRLAAFARAVVDDPNVAPNHGWRHTFKTRGLEAGIDHRVLDAIQGQRPRTVAESYGDVTIKTLGRAMAKFPRYRLPSRSAPRRK